MSPVSPVGIIDIHASKRTGCVAGDAYVELMLITQQGKILRTVIGDIRPIGRATQGVRLNKIDQDDRVVSLARLAGQDARGRVEPGDR